MPMPKYELEPVMVMLPVLARPVVVGAPVKLGEAKGAFEARVVLNRVPFRLMEGVASTPVKLGESRFALVPSAVVRVGML